MAGSDRPPPRASDPGPGYALAAPSAVASTPVFFPPSQQEWPSLDDRLAEPETPEEYIRGERYYDLGSLDPHADQHFRLDYVLAPYVQDGYIGATDLLTRASKGSDFASDTSIRKAGQDPTTGTRYLEEIAFEIINEQSASKAKNKAEDLTRRGVRRVFGIFVKTGEVKEWSQPAGAWKSLGATIDDPRCLRTSLPVKALLDAVEADRAVVTGVLAKQDPEIDDAVASILVERGNRLIGEREAASKAEGLKEGKKEGLREGKKEGFREGEAKGMANAIVATLTVRGVPVSESARSRILACRDLPTLNGWLVRAMQASSADEVIAG